MEPQFIKGSTVKHKLYGVGRVVIVWNGLGMLDVYFPQYRDTLPVADLDCRLVWRGA